jgi:glycosyltransferase involved in cell wall biosynthesis
MIGDGPRRVALEKATSREAWGRQILWLGAVDARRHMPAFDLLACSSDYEGFAYAFLEALHVGLPIVTTDVGGAAEAVEHGKNGFIVPVRRPAALTVALKRIIEDDRLRREMATASQVRATRYTLPVMIDALERHYAELAPQVRARSGAPRPGEAAQAETTG